MGKRNRPRGGGGNHHHHHHRSVCRKRTKQTTDLDVHAIDTSHHHGDDASELPLPSSSSSSSASSSWHRLTHPGTDAATRHMILAALRHTRFHPDVLAAAQRNVPYPSELLQAVVQQVMPRSSQSSEYHPSSSSSSSRSKGSSQSKTNEIHCSIAAVACLSDYVAYTPNLNDNNDNETLLEQDATVTIEWLPMFIQRLQDCLLHCDEAFSSSAISSTNNTTTTNNNTTTSSVSVSAHSIPTATDSVWLELLEECLTAIVQVVEQNHLSTSRLLTRYHHNNNNNNNTNTTGRYDYSVWHCLVQLLQQSQAKLLLVTPAHSTKSQSPELSVPASSSSSLDDVRRTWDRIQTLTTQCLHSAWDDNTELITALFFISPHDDNNNDANEGPAVARQLLSSLQHILTRTEPSFASSSTTTATAHGATATATARLHAAGATMAFWHARETLRNESSSPSLLVLRDDAIVESVCRLAVHGVQQALTQALVLFQTPDLVQRFVEQIRTAEADYRVERNDDQMEQDVLHHQHVKQEPARHIARRLHPHPASSSSSSTTTTATAATKTTTTTVDATKDNVTTDGETKSKTSKTKVAIQRKNATALWETVQTEWEDMIRPLQLALELVANWTSGSTDESDEQGADDGNDDIDDTEEDAIMYDVVQQTSLSPELVTCFNESQLPLLVAQILQVLSEWWCHPHNQPTTSSSSEGLDTSPPMIVIESITDCLSKAVVAVGHCRAAALGAEVPWPILMAIGRTLAKRAKDNTGGLGDASSDADTSVLVALTSTMVVALKNNPTLGAQVDNATLDSLLILLSVTAKTYPIAAREIVAMLGLFLCNITKRTAQSVALCRQITRALIVASTPSSETSPDGNTVGVGRNPSSLVLAEVLNVFMDIYGGDEDEMDTALSFNRLFDELGLLSHFQRSVPLLKLNISVEQLTNKSSEEDLDMWEETVENASRFIEYQKEQAR